MDPILTVTTAAADPALLTIEEARAAVGATDESQDTTLERLIPRVSASIATACGVQRAGIAPPTLRQEVLSASYRRDGLHGGSWTSHNRRLILPRVPITSIASITEDDVALTAADYELQMHSGLLHRLRGTYRTCWYAAVTVVAFTAGWDVVPDDLKLAAEQYLRNLMSGASRDPYAKRVEIPGVETTDFWVGPIGANAVPDDVLSLLYAGGYAHVNVG